MAGNATVHPVDDYLFVRRSGDDDEVEVDMQDPNRILRGAIVAQGPGLPAMGGDKDRIELVVTGPTGLQRVLPGDGVIYKATDASELKLESGTYDLVRFSSVIAVLKADVSTETVTPAGE